MANWIPLWWSNRRGMNEETRRVQSFFYHREHEVHREDTEGKLDLFVVEQPQRNE
jgi:hypothetical protein